MSRLQRSVMRRFYREAAGDPARLPWHAEDPPGLLEEAVAALGPGARVLDVGCGAGVFAVWLARRGLAVTAIDYLEEATAMAGEAAAAAGVEVEVQWADFLALAPQRPFDLVFDSGCLHNMSTGEMTRYRASLLRCLEPGGDYVLSHWGKRGALDWRPIGPRRRRRARIETWLGQEFVAVGYTEIDESVPLPFGPKVRCASYRFTRRR